MFLKFFSKKDKSFDEFAATRIDAEFGVDLEMNYCPRCGDEYRADIEVCAACEIALIGGGEKLAQCQKDKEQIAGRSMDISPDDKRVTIQKGSIKEIKVLRSLLANERIPAIIAGDEASCRKGCSGPEMFLQIREQDVEAALEIIARDFAKSTALYTHDIAGATAVFDHLAKETACPACGCRFSPTVGACPECGLCFE